MSRKICSLVYGIQSLHIACSSISHQRSFNNCINHPKLHDMRIMVILLQLTLTPDQLKIVSCRLYLRSIYVSNITDATGSKIKTPYQPFKFVDSRRPSNFSWPALPLYPPAPSQWKIWTAVLLSTICHDDLTLSTPLRPMDRPNTPILTPSNNLGIFPIYLFSQCPETTPIQQESISNHMHHRRQ
jgi:hypothetical protein